MARVVVVAGVEQCDAAVERFVDGGDAFALVGGPVHAGHPHAAERQREDLGAGAEPAAVRALLCHHGSKLDSPGIRWEEGSPTCHTHLEETITPTAHLTVHAISQSRGSNHGFPYFGVCALHGVRSRTLAAYHRWSRTHLLGMVDALRHRNDRHRGRARPDCRRRLRLLPYRADPARTFLGPSDPGQR